MPKTLSFFSCLFCTHFWGMELIGLSSFCGELNLSGLVTIEYVPITWVNVPAYHTANIYPLNHLSNVPLLSGKVWLKAPSLQGKRIWNEEQEDTEQGIFYAQSVNLIIPGMKPEGAKEIENMGYHRFLIRLKDVSGVYWVMGNLETPFRLSASGTTGEGGGRKQHTLSLVCQTKRKAIGFTI